MYLEEKAKNHHLHERRKVGRSNATPIKLLLVNYHDLKTLSSEFGIDTSIIFEMPR